MNEKKRIEKGRKVAMKLYKGKCMSVKQFLEFRAKDLPEVIDRSTGQPFDHAASLKKIYLERGEPGVDQYVSRVRAINLRDNGKRRRDRFCGSCMVAWYRLIG